MTRWDWNSDYLASGKHRKNIFCSWYLEDLTLIMEICLDIASGYSLAELFDNEWITKSPPFLVTMNFLEAISDARPPTFIDNQLHSPHLPLSTNSLFFKQVKTWSVGNQPYGSWYASEKTAGGRGDKNMWEKNLSNYTLGIKTGIFQ